MNEMKESKFAEIAAKVKRNNGKLPRVEWFRVDIDGGTGTADTWHKTGYRLVVKLQGIDGEYATSSVAAAYGMKVKRVYKTAEEAKADGFKFKKTWGRNKQSKKEEAVQTATLKALAAMSKDELEAVLAAVRAAA